MSIWFKKDSVASTLRSYGSRPKGKLIPMNRSQLSNLKAVFTRMIEDCRKLGATEIFIGSDGRHSFQCKVGEETYSGNLPIGARDSLEKLSFKEYPIYLNWDELQVANLKIGITTTGSSPVFCLSWNERIESRVEDESESSSFVDEPATDSPLALIVDDDPRFSQILCRILEEQNFQTLVAFNGKEALSILEEFNPSLIITDIHMPHLSGPELLLESRKRGFEIPCLVLTNDEDALTEAELVLLGAAAFIKKSEDPRVLLAWCRRLTCLRRIS